MDVCSAMADFDALPEVPVRAAAACSWEQRQPSSHAILNRFGVCAASHKMHRNQHRAPRNAGTRAILLDARPSSNKYHIVCS